jgi:hypothetical protein
VVGKKGNNVASKEGGEDKGMKPASVSAVLMCSGMELSWVEQMLYNALCVLEDGQEIALEANGVY